MQGSGKLSLLFYLFLFVCYFVDFILSWTDNLVKSIFLLDKSFIASVMAIVACLPSCSGCHYCTTSLGSNPAGCVLEVLILRTCDNSCGWKKGAFLGKPFLKSAKSYHHHRHHHHTQSHNLSTSGVH